MRIDQLQQVLGKARKPGLDLELDPGGEEGEALQEPFHIGVGALQVPQRQAAGDLRELLGELPPHLPHEGQLLLIMV
jgi:hypothetical protein